MFIRCDKFWLSSVSTDSYRSVLSRRLFQTVQPSIQRWKFQRRLRLRWGTRPCWCNLWSNSIKLFFFLLIQTATLKFHNAPYNSASSAKSVNSFISCNVNKQTFTSVHLFCYCTNGQLGMHTTLNFFEIVQHMLVNPYGLEKFDNLQRQGIQIVITLWCDCSIVYFNLIVLIRWIVNCSQ